MTIIVWDGETLATDCAASDGAAQWDEWYRRLPDDLKRRLSAHDFKRSGDLFKEVFNVQ